jgi:oligosaccharyl transferase (archaeosortase A-associated)
VLSPRIARALLLVLAFAAALLLRSLFSYDTVFRGSDVVFQDPDAAFHVRTIQNLVQHFPYRTGLDPYSGFPRGQNVDTGPFHDYAIGTLAWVAGLGAPSRYLTNVIAAWFPAILGALMVIPVYFLGRALFSPVVGGIAAGLIAILPGSFLWVSRLGNPDHHVSEVMLSTLLLLLLVNALESEARWRLVVAAGLVLGCYLATQTAGVFLVLFVEIWALLQVCANHWRGARSRLVWSITVPPMCIGWGIFLLAGPTIWSNITTLVLFACIASISGAVALSEKLRSRWQFLLALLGSLVAAVVAIAYLKPDLVAAALSSITGRSAGPAQTVGELRPLLTANGTFSLAPAWGEFSTCWFLAPLALLYVGWHALRLNSPAQLLFAIWSALVMAASFQHIRNCYYLAVNMAVLTGVACEHLMRLERRYERILASLLLGAALVLPNVSLARGMLSSDNGPRQDWLSALAYLRNETPEPFGDAAAYDRYFPRRAEDAVFPYPKSAYGIMSWWDFGHWISAYGRRIPIANGMQTGASDAARFFLATDPNEAAALLRHTGGRYIIADSSMPLGGPQFFEPSNGSMQAMMTWAQQESEKYWEEYLTGAPGTDSERLPVFYPAYYQSMLARLYLFEGQPQTPAGSTWVIQYSEENWQGKLRKRLKRSERFATYEQAQRYVREHPGSPLVLVGLDPSRSCVPIGRLEGYQMSYTSQAHPLASGELLRAVKIFEYRQL